MGTPYVRRQVTHLFTIDVEDYFQAAAFEQLIPRDSWETRESRVERNVDRLLGMLASVGATATFFMLAWTAERYPALLRRIVREGHEIASRGVARRRVDRLTITEFRDEARTSRATLEDLSGTHVIGFRAPSFSIVPSCEWAFDVLVEEGYEYDSSRAPLSRGDLDSSRTPPYAHVLDTPSGTLIEVPPTTFNAFGVRVPAGNGEFLRRLPYAILREELLTRERSSIPGVLSVHPWELDPDQPRLNAPWITRARHYGGLRSTAPRLERLLRDFQFGAIAGSLPVVSQNAPLVLA